MRVKIRVPVAGTRWAARPGSIVDLPKTQAKGFIASGVAEAVDASEAETATAEPPENAAKSRPARRKRGGKRAEE